MFDGPTQSVTPTTYRFELIGDETLYSNSGTVSSAIGSISFHEGKQFGFSPVLVAGIAEQRPFSGAPEKYRIIMR